MPRSHPGHTLHRRSRPRISNDSTYGTHAHEEEWGTSRSPDFATTQRRTPTPAPAAPRQRLNAATPADPSPRQSPVEMAELAEQVEARKPGELVQIDHMTYARDG